jgi:hypothetical protein
VNVLLGVHHTNGNRLLTCIVASACVALGNSERCYL